MAFYLLQEDGNKLTLEDASGFVLLEEQVPAATIRYGGDDAPKRRKRRHETQELFAAIELTIQELLGLAPEPRQPDIQPALSDAHADGTRSASALAGALAELAALAAGWEDLETRLERLREAVAAYEARRRADFLTDEEDTWMLMS